MTDTISTIAAMCRQEDMFYKKSDPIDYWMKKSSNEENKLYAVEVDQDCRCKMATWCFEIVTFCDMQREIVEIALSYLDRYVMTEQGLSALQNHNVYQLACVAALYTAIKIHEPKILDPKLLSRLSQGLYNPREIEIMECRILDALKWHMNPPTTLSFTRQYLELLPNDIFDDNVKMIIYDRIKLQSEEAMKIYEFLTVKASTLAYCLLLNSFEQFKFPNDLVTLFNDELQNELCGVVIVELTEDIRCICDFLHISFDCLVDNNDRQLNGRDGLIPNRNTSYKALDEISSSPRSSVHTAVSAIRV